METRRLDWNGKEARAKKMSVAELEYAIKDCMECVKVGSPDSGYYQDEASVYRTELTKRANKKVAKPVKKTWSETRTEWTTKELTEDFSVLGFQAPFVVVVRKADGVKGSLEFTHSPRLYFNWTEHKE